LSAQSQLDTFVGGFERSSNQVRHFALMASSLRRMKSVSMTMISQL